MPLTPEGKELLKLAKESILTNPEFYDQDDFAYQDVGKCGTVCCVAGWIDFLHFGAKEHMVRVSGFADMWGSSGKLLGLESYETTALFETANCHPDERFVKEYEAAETPSDRAKAAGRMIDRFIASHT